MSHYVYKITAIRSDRVYLGKAKDPVYRFKGHLREAKNGLRYKNGKSKHNIRANWIRKHGEENMRLEILAGPFDTKAEAFAEEIRLIAEYRAAGIPLANDPRSIGGEDPPDHTGVKRRPETVAKLKAAVKEAMNRPEIRAKSLAGNLGRKKSPESVAKMKAGLTGKKHSEQSKANMLAGQMAGHARKKLELHRWADDGGRS
jgi:hypothetical protein